MPSDRPTRSPTLMSRDTTAVLVVDLQQRLLSAQPEANTIVWNARRLLDGAKALGIATAATEQVPAKLGPTTSDLAERLPPPIAKLAFSAGACEDLIAGWHSAGMRHLVVAGIETHVCVAQTALDLLAAGFEPVVAVDAVGSRFSIDHKIALQRLEASAVILSTTEAILFEWCETAADPAFKAISALVKEPKPGN